MKFYGIVEIVKLDMINVGDTQKIEILSKTLDKNNEQTLVLEAWDTAAQFISNNMREEVILYVEGLLRNESWEKDGVKRNKICLRITSFKGLF